MSGSDKQRLEKMLDVKCPGCGTEYEVEVGEVGQEAICEICGRKFIIADSRRFRISKINFVRLAIAVIIYIVVVAGWRYYRGKRADREAIESRIESTIANLSGTNSILKRKIFELNLDEEREIRNCKWKSEKDITDREHADAMDGLNKARELGKATSERERDAINRLYESIKRDREAEYNVKVAASRYAIASIMQHYAEQRSSISKEISDRECAIDILRGTLNDIEKHPIKEEDLGRILHKAESDPEAFVEASWNHEKRGEVWGKR